MYVSRDFETHDDNQEENKTEKANNRYIRHCQ
jgi:hypothetical protein